MKVSFDFDSTLDNFIVQEYAKLLIRKRVKVWVCTSRVSCEEALKRFKVQGYNDDLFEITDMLGIPRERIIFTNHELKIKFLKDRNFLWHLDDDSVELTFFKDTNVKGINVIDKNWKSNCQKLLENE